MQRYNPNEIEPKWQKIWDETNVYTADLHSKKPKYIAMSMFNYPSGNLHIGHAMNYTISDVKARFKRQQGFESYHPVGWDSFGLPAENRAIKEKMSPQESMAQLIPDYRKAYKAMGWSNDWEKEIATHTPEYYKWTQWIFSQMYKHKLAYQDARMQWWCEKCQTVLANEQIIDDKCWRHDGADDAVVEKKEVKQWFFKITEYADELLEAIDDLDWTESVKLAQKNWIGRSTGAEITFKVCRPELDSGSSPVASEHDEEEITVFTTRADTLFGVTFLVIAPESDIVAKITSSSQKADVEAYITSTAKKTEVERQAAKDKTGVFTGSYAINPINGVKIPIWIADYVLGGYGTGAIMAVPAHDERDNEFAKTFKLPIAEVIEAKTFDSENPPQDGKKNTKRNVAICVIEDEAGKFLTLKWNKLDWHNFVMGGIEDGEEFIEAAKREITEETGFTDLEFVSRMPFALNSVFYAAHKDVNRDIRVDVLRFNLKSRDQVALKRESHEDFEVNWVEKFELNSLGPVGGLDYIVQWINDGDCVHTGEGRVTDSGEYTHLDSATARKKIVRDLAKKGAAQEKVNYKMRDWSVSRQRYWGAPIPIVNCDTCGTVLIPDDDLPVVLPELTDFQPSGDGRSALARAADWLKTSCPKCGGEAERETDTLDTYICSSWYMFRYFDPHNQQKAFDPEVVNTWAPIDFYNGGDHATAHMLYARFVTRFFSTIGLIDNPEPFKQFLFNGKVVASDGKNFSKTLGNGPDPLEIIGQGYGADALRTYLMFAAPLEFGSRWDPQGVPGAFRFLSRLWNLVQEYQEQETGELAKDEATKLRQSVARMVKKITEDIEENRYNTAIAAAMGGLNDLYKQKTIGLIKGTDWHFALESIVACVAPFAPHVADELWQQLGHSSSIHSDSWPEIEQQYLMSDQVKIVIQVNGKVRGTVMMLAESRQDEVESRAKKDDKVQSHLEDKELKKVIYIPNKLINFVV